MPDALDDIRSRLKQHAPFDLVAEEEIVGLAADVLSRSYRPDDTIYADGEALSHLYVVEAGHIDVESPDGDVVSRRGPGDIMGRRGLLRDGRAVWTARAIEPVDLLLVPIERFKVLLETVPSVAAWFEGAGASMPVHDKEPTDDLATIRVSELMAKGSVTCGRDTRVSDAARIMRDAGTHSVTVVDSRGPVGIVTTVDLARKVLANDLGGEVLVEEVMTPDPVTIESDALAIDALGALTENNIRQIPVVRERQVIGLVEMSRLLDRKADTTSQMIIEILGASTATEMAAVTARIPSLLAHLVGSGAHPTRVGRRITDITDAVTRRLITLAEEELGASPVPYLWLACGSQGRREQTGTSDQDNCLILDDSLKPGDEPYFERLATIVTDGLNRCGYVYCPGDMMARNPTWRQPRRVWRDYFSSWIEQPDNMAQMLASVMFDLRPIAGETALFDDLQDEVLTMAGKNSIFVAHMISNSLKHEPPLSLFRGLALIRSGEHKNMLDLKLSGVVPVTDLARIYALQGGIAAVGTADRLEQARDRGVISQAGAHDLIDAYDLIALTRLKHQAAQARKGVKPDNFISPRQLSELERNHLRDAFAVIKTMQSSLRHGRAAMA